MLKNAKKNGPAKVQEEPPARDLKKELQQAEERRVKACWADIAAALEKHRCVLGAMPYIEGDGRIFAKPGVRASDE